MGKKILLAGIAGVAIAAVVVGYFLMGSDMTAPVANPPKDNDCEGINNQIQKSACYVALAATEGDSRYCWNAKGDEIIYTCIAAATHDTGPCKKIEDEDFQKACEDPVHMYWALKNNDASQCARITTENIAETCRQSLGAVTSASECGRNSECYRMLGARNPASCEGVENENYREDCMIGAAKAAGNWQYCLQIEDLGLTKENCLEDVLGADNPKLCEIENEDIELRDECYDQMAFDLEKPEICAKISDPDMKEDCYYYATP